MEGLGKIVLVLSQILAGLLSGGLITNILGLAFGRKMFGFMGNAFKGGFNLLKGLFKGGKGAQVAKTLPAIGTQFKTEGAYLSYKEALKSGGTHDYAMKVAKIREASDLRKMGSVASGVAKASKAGSLLTNVGRLGLGAVRGIPGLVAGLVATPLANKAVSMGANAYLTHGLSGGVQGALTGAALGSIVPVIGTGVGAAIGGVVGGISGLIKGHFAKQEKEQDESKNFWHELLDMLRNSKLGKWLGLGGNEGSSGSSGGSFVNNVVEGVKSKFLGALGKDQDTKKVSSVGALELNKAGGMINIGSMNKMQASNAVLEYMNKRPDQFKSAYELVGSKYASLGSFQNDLAIRNKQGSATQAVLYAGATKNLENAWDALEKAGFNRNRAELMKYTSGRSTATSVHGKYGARSHSNIMNMTTDLAVGNQWTDAEWKKAIEVLRPIYAQQGFDLQFEGKDKKGKTIIGSNYVPGLSNKHFHVGLLKGKEGLMPQSALEYQEQQKVVAQKHSIDTIGLVTKLEGKEKAEEIGKAHLGDDKAFKEAYEKVLRDHGITHKTDSKGKERWYYHDNEQNVTKEFDPTGNLDALKKQMTYMTNNAQ